MTKAAEGIGAAIGWVRPLGLALGFIAALGLQLLPPPEGLSREAWVVASMGLMMVIFWFTEALPLPMTALIPLLALPMFAGVTPAAAATPYANPIVLLFIGGFMLAIAIERWRLSTRIAYSIVAAAGTRPRLIVGGFMVASALISMWISNTATALMMTPLAVGVAIAAGGDKLDWRYAAALVLGVAWAVSIGGIGTPIGTPTNLIAISWLREQGRDIDFVTWMAMGVPLMMAMLVVGWLLLTGDLKVDRAAGEETRAEVRELLAQLGRVTTPELRVALIFLVTAFLWMSQGLLAGVPGLGGLNDMSIGIFAALALFVVPAGGREGKGRALLIWEEGVRLPWGIILLFGGGFALADAATRTGLGAWLGESLGGLADQPGLIVVGVAMLMPVIVTQVNSNMSTIAMMLPVLAPLSMAAGVEPAALAVPAGVVASFAYTMPVSTAPNAIAFATGKVPLLYMATRGAALGLVGLILITLIGYYYVPVLLAG